MDEVSETTAVAVPRWMRLAFYGLVVAVALWVIGGLLYGYYQWSFSSNGSQEDDFLDKLTFVLVNMASPVARALIALLVGGLILQAVSWLSGAPAPQRVEEVEQLPWWAGAFVLRLLLSFLVVFAVVWAVTGVLTAEDQVELQHGVNMNTNPFDPAEVDESSFKLEAIHLASYFVGLATFTILTGIALIQAVHHISRLRAIRASSS